MNHRELPPAIVLGGDTPIGLTIVRELGENGVPTHVVARSRAGIALYSRWTASRHVRNSDDSATIALLNRIARTHGARYVLAVSDSDRLLVRRAADQNQLPGLLVLVPPATQLQLANDKLAIYGVATEIGLPVPRTWQPLAEREISSIPTDLTYPCILKWRDPELVSRALAHLGLPLLKAEYCYDVERLALALDRYRLMAKYPMVQEYCPGVGIGHMLFMYQGKARLAFQHIRRAEWPPEGGTSTVCASLAPSFHPDWLAKSEELLRRIGWEGAAMVEYRYDPRSDRRALMEINGRFWGSLPLAYHSGARFGWLTYVTLGLGEIPAQTHYRAGIVCRYMIPETRRVLTVLFRQRVISDRSIKISRFCTMFCYVSAFLSPSTRYYVFRFSDPLPFFVDMARLLQKALGLIWSEVSIILHTVLGQHDL